MIKLGRGRQTSYEVIIMNRDKISSECSACQLFGDYMCAGMEEFDCEECEEMKTRRYGKLY